MHKYQIKYKAVKRYLLGMVKMNIETKLSEIILISIYIGSILTLSYNNNIEMKNEKFFLNRFISRLV